MTKDQRRTVVLFLPIVLLLAVADVFAQDKGDTGITMGYPVSVGFVFHVSDRFAIRPELDLSVSSGESDAISGSSSSSSDGSRVGVGLSALFYLGSTDKLRPYVAPRYVFSHTSSSSDSPVSESESTLTSHAFGGFFGAQVLPARPLQRLRRGRRHSHVRFDEVRGGFRPRHAAVREPGDQRSNGRRRHFLLLALFRVSSPLAHDTGAPGPVRSW